MFDRLFAQVLDMSFTGSLVIVAVIIARLPLRKAPKVFSYALWSVVLFRLLCPVTLEAPVSVVPDLPSFSDGYTLAGEPIDFAGAGEAAYQAVEDALNLGVLDDRFVRTTERDESGMSRYVLTDWQNVWILFGAYIWLAGMGLMAAYSLVSYWNIRKKTAVSVPAGDQVYLADDIASPFVIGLLRPRIYLPGNLRPEEQEYILLHERYHIRRLDHWAKALAFLALTIHWFNPLVWLAFLLASRDMEMSCDEAVICKAGEGLRASYAASLLTLATGKRIIAGTPLAFGEGDPKERIKNLSSWKRPGLWMVILTVVLCVVLAVCLVTNPLAADGNVGRNWYYGTVSDASLDGPLPFITLDFPDGSQRTFPLNDSCELPTEAFLGKSVAAYGFPRGNADEIRISQVRLAAPPAADALEEAVRNAVIAHNSGKYYPGQCRTAHFKELSRAEMGIVSEGGTKNVEQITLYGIARYQEFSLTDGILVDDSGSNCPVVMTFVENPDGTFTLAEYWEPRDGSYYPEDVKAKFRGRPFPRTDKYLAESGLSCLEQAREQLGASRAVVVDTILADIVASGRWGPVFSDRERHEIVNNNDNLAMLRVLGADTLGRCFERFLTEELTDTTLGDVMASVCLDVMEHLGETPHTDWEDVGSCCGGHWFEAFAAKAETMADTPDLKTRYPGTWVYLVTAGKLPETPAWVTMEALDVTPNGLTLAARQNYDLPMGHLITGQPYVLQVLKDGQWQNVSPIVDNVVWTMEGWPVPPDETVRWEVNWSWIYGRLKPGVYRIGKSFTLTPPGTTLNPLPEQENFTVFAQFEVE